MDYWTLAGILVVVIGFVFAILVIYQAQSRGTARPLSARATRDAGTEDEDL